MGDPRRLRKKYSPPKEPWSKSKIVEEKRLMSAYGLKNKKEIYRIDKIVGKYKYIARKLVGKPPAERKSEESKLLEKLTALGVLKQGATLDDVLMLKNEDFLERRIQTLVWKKGIASTIKQARQFVTHGYIGFRGGKTTTPGVLIPLGEENLVAWYKHPIQITLKKAAQIAAKEEEAKAKAQKKDKEDSAKMEAARAAVAAEEAKKEAEKPAPKKKGRKKKEESDDALPKDSLTKLEDKVLEKLDEKKK